MTRRISEPSLPEHELIRAAGELPKLSSGFRDATLTICQSQIVRAQRIQRTKITAAVAACGLLFAIMMSLVMLRPDHPAPIAQDDVPVVPHETPSSGDGPSNSGSVLSAGSPGNSGIPLPTEAQQLDRLIEDTGRRSQKLIDAGMVPGF